MAKNLVVYSIEGSQRRPVGSFAPEGHALALQLSYAAVRAFLDADGRGAPHPDVRLVLEERTVRDESGAINAKYQETDQHGKPRGSIFDNLDALFASFNAPPVAAKGG